MYDPSRGYPVVVPCVLYDDLPAAAGWLTATLGFREILRATRPDDPAGERPWGVLQGVLADPEGQRWLVASHARDTDPTDWYGTVTGPMPG